MESKPSQKVKVNGKLMDSEIKTIRKGYHHGLCDLEIRNIRLGYHLGFCELYLYSLRLSAWFNLR
jgi:hypothetical protein